MSLEENSPVYSKGINVLKPDTIRRLDPAFVAVYNEVQPDRVMAHQVSIEQFRKHEKEYRVIYGLSDEKLPDPKSITRYYVPVKNPDMEIPVDVYTPHGSGPFPVYINYHGGGWVLGASRDDERWSKYIVDRVKCVIVDVSYRLSPEYPFPTSNYDACAAYDWVRQNHALLNIDPEKIAVGGASAGGHLAAIVALYCRDNGFKLCHQLLVVPVCDLRYVPLSREEDALVKIGNPYQSYHDMEFAACLPLKRMQWFTDLWLGTDPEHRRQSAESWQASIICHPDVSNVAPASLMLAECDPLCSEGVEYGKKLALANVTTTIKVFPKVPHSFFRMTSVLQQARDYHELTARALESAFASDGKP